MRAELRRLATWLAVAFPIYGVIRTLVSIDADDPAMTVMEWASIVVAWGILSLLMPLIVLVADRWPFDRRPMRSALVHAVVLPAIVAIHVSIVAGADWLMAAVPPATTLKSMWSMFFKYDLMAYALSTAAVSVLHWQRRARRTELAAARLRHRLAHAAWIGIRSHVEPQTLFVALEESEACISSDPLAAEDRLQRLCHFLRERLEVIKRAAQGSRRPRVTRTTARGPLVTWFVAALLYPAFGVTLNAIFMSIDVINGEAWEWRRASTVLGFYVLGGMLSFIVVGVVRLTHSLMERHRLTAITLIAAACATHAVLVAELTRALRAAVGLPRAQNDAFATMLLLSAVVVYLARSHELERRSRATRLQSEELARLIEEARLRSLRTALAPHFLFNTLNSVLALVPRDADAARAMVARLRRLLRASIESDARQEVTLREELEIVRGYVDIETIRFRDALQVSLDVDASLLDARVPSFLLQPLVENAIRHGVLGMDGSGRIRVSVRQRDANRIELSVENRGEVLDAREWQEGIGLSTTRARLLHLYGANHELRIETDAGVRVMIIMPLVLAEAA